MRKWHKVTDKLPETRRQDEAVLGPPLAMLDRSGSGAGPLVFLCCCQGQVAWALADKDLAAGSGVTVCISAWFRSNYGDLGKCALSLACLLTCRHEVRFIIAHSQAAVMGGDRSDF